MFSKEIRTILTVLGNALLFLAMLGIDSEHDEMTASDYLRGLDADDAPDVGTDVTPTITNTPEQVFAPEAPATVFAAPQPPAYTMTAKAEGFTREEYHAQKWTDDMLLEHGYMVATLPVDNRPNVPAAPAATISPAPAPASVSTQVAAPSAPAPTDAPPAGTVAHKDANGLPWDARIHSSNRTMTTKGAWQKRKGVSDGLVAQVTSELLNAAAQVTTPFTPLVAPAPQQAAPAPVAPPAAAAAPAPAPAPQAPAAGISEPATTFPALCQWLTPNGFTPMHALPFCNQFGLTSFGNLAEPNNAAFIPLVQEALAKSRG